MIVLACHVKADDIIDQVGRATRDAHSVPGAFGKWSIEVAYFYGPVETFNFNEDDEIPVERHNSEAV